MGGQWILGKAKHFFASLIFFLSVSSLENLWALPGESLLLEARKSDKYSWSLAPIYRFRPSAGLGFTADLGLQGLYHLGGRSEVIAHAKHNSILGAYSREISGTTSWPQSLLLGVDLAHLKMSYLIEWQMDYTRFRHAPYVTLRAQNTGFSPSSGDGVEFSQAPASRFWLLSSSLGWHFSPLEDLSLHAALVYQYGLPDIRFRDPVLFHFAFRWDWGPSP